MIDIFDEVIELPDPEADKQFQQLVGLDHVKELLLKEGRLLLNPELLEEWSEQYHGAKIPAITRFQERPPLILFSGDVGTGKTTLANSFGSAVARSENIKITVLRLSLMTRGRGAVGEMTTLVSQAFKEVEAMASRGVVAGKKSASAVILIIDEADTLAESRAQEQMHHEDRAGVNALIRGIDQLTQKHLPIIVVFCTNRYEAMDPAILRRAADHHVFERPNTEQRTALLQKAFGEILNQKELQQLSDITGPSEGRSYGYTFSDITQRFVPNVLLEAFPDKKVTIELAIAVAKTIEPTAPFDGTKT